MTRRLYWQDDHCYSAEARVVAVAGSEVSCDQTCFYPGGGGQPPDLGALMWEGERWAVTSVRADAEGVVWHALDREASELLGRVARPHRRRSPLSQGR